MRLLDSVLPGGVKQLLPSQGWRIYTVADDMPRFDPRSWWLRIDGLVANPHELIYRDLLQLPRVEQTSGSRGAGQLILAAAANRGWSSAGIPSLPGPPA